MTAAAMVQSDPTFESPRVDGESIEDVAHGIVELTRLFEKRGERIKRRKFGLVKKAHHEAITHCIRAKRRDKIVVDLHRRDAQLARYRAIDLWSISFRIFTGLPQRPIASKRVWKFTCSLR
jgi:hypothetical protein